MSPDDRLAYERAMIALQDVREECLSHLDDEPPVAITRRGSRWWAFVRRTTHSPRRLAS